MEYYIAKFNIRCTKEAMPDEAILKQAAADLLMTWVANAGFESFEETAEGVDGYVQTNIFNKQMLDDMIKEFPLENIKISYKLHKAENKDWNQTWEANGFQPIIINNKCVIHDTLHEVPASLGNTLNITIETRQAFGTGTHETTRMIVSHLLDMNLSGKSVLDCGCGTGILSIVASRQGAKNVLGYDIDEWSVENTRHNAELNNVRNIEVLYGDVNVLSHVSGLFDVVLANINRNILLADMMYIKNVMSSESTLILSGFYKEDANMLIDRAAELNLSLADMNEDNGWCMLVFVSSNT